MQTPEQTEKHSVACADEGGEACFARYGFENDCSSRLQPWNGAYADIACRLQRSAVYVDEGEILRDQQTWRLSAAVSWRLEMKTLSLVAVLMLLSVGGQSALAESTVQSCVDHCFASNQHYQDPQQAYRAIMSCLNACPQPPTMKNDNTREQYKECMIDCYRAYEQCVDNVRQKGLDPKAYCGDSFRWCSERCRNPTSPIACLQ